jgi:hypothetical protein
MTHTRVRAVMGFTEKAMKTLVLGALVLVGATAGAAAGWDDSYRDCPGAWGCPSAHYSPSFFHRGPDYRYLPSAYRYTYFYRYTGRGSHCMRRGHRARCR